MLRTGNTSPHKAMAQGQCFDEPGMRMNIQNPEINLRKEKKEYAKMIMME